MTQDNILDETKFLRLVSDGNLKSLKTSFCRLCLTGYCDLFNINETFINDKSNPVTSILNSLSLKVDTNNIYPQVVCANCLNKLINIYNFQKKCISSIRKLDELYQKMMTMSETDIVDIEDAILIVIPEYKAENDISSVLKDIIDKINLTLKCRMCSELFLTTESFQNHIVTIHGVKKYDEYCCKKSVTKRKENEVKCSYCGEKIFKGFHVNTQEKKCDMCQQIYPCQGLLMNHIKNIHSDSKLSNEVTTNRKRKIREDELKNKEKVFECNICGRKYYTLNGLSKHKSAHFNIFICDYCGVKYTKKENLSCHILIKHMKSVKFFCEPCKKGFHFYRDYANHQTVHTKVRPFQCHTCGKKFVAKNTLTNHMRLHTGERPYLCTLCNDRFVSATRLNEHVKLKHIGKVKCPKCNKEFTRKESVTKHLKLQRC